MLLSHHQASQLSLLTNDLEAHSAFLKLLDIYHKGVYTELRDSTDIAKIHQLQGKLQLIDDLKDLRERVKDSLKHGNKPESEHLQSNW